MLQMPQRALSRQGFFAFLAGLTLLVMVPQKIADLRPIKASSPAEEAGQEWMALDFTAKYVLFLEKHKVGELSLGSSLRQEFSGLMAAWPEGQGSLSQSRCLGILWTYLGKYDRADTWFAHAITKAREKALPIRPEQNLWRALTHSPSVPVSVLKTAPSQVAAMNLGWYGDLALAELFQKGRQSTQAQAYWEAVYRQCRRTVVTVLGLVGFLALGTLVGIILGVLFWVFHSAGELPWVGLPKSLPAGLLAETFILYLFLAAVIAPLIIGLGRNAFLGGSSSLLHVAPALFGYMGITALSLLWPLWQSRRASLQPAPETAREDSVEELPEAPPALPRSAGALLGWHTPHWGREFLWGVGGYLVLLPFLGIALLLLILILRWGGPNLSLPAHPLVPMFAAAPSRGAVVVFALLGSLLAPLIEETLFRGALYGALRQRWGIGSSALISSAIFSILHPQLPWGFLPLFILGIGFALLYEMRGSLIPSMVAHALTNGVTLCLLYGFVGMP